MSLGLPASRAHAIPVTTAPRVTQVSTCQNVTLYETSTTGLSNKVATDSLVSSYVYKHAVFIDRSYHLMHVTASHDQQAMPNPPDTFLGWACRASAETGRHPAIMSFLLAQLRMVLQRLMSL